MVFGIAGMLNHQREEEYQRYVELTKSLPREMKSRAISEMNLMFDDIDFKVRSDGTAEIPLTSQPFLSRLGLRPIATRKVNLENIGELLFVLTLEDGKYPHGYPQVREIFEEDITQIISALSWAECGLKSLENPGQYKFGKSPLD